MATKTTTPIIYLPTVNGANGYGTNSPQQFVVSGNGYNSSGITGGSGSQWSSNVQTVNGLTSSSGVTDEGVVNTIEESLTGDSTTTSGSTTNGTTTELDLTYGTNLGTGATTVNEDLTENTEEEEEEQWTYAKYLEYLERLKQQAYETAEAQKQRSIVDANTSYAQNKATYGANAETLASMGLTGSGYSDYINSQAYAQNRSDIQSANVTYAEAIQNADTTYASNMLDYYNTVEEKYEWLLDAVNNGTYTADDIDGFAEQYGFSETQINSLKSAAETYSSTENTSYYSGLLSSVTASTTDAEIEAWADTYSLSDEQIASIKAQRDSLYTINYYDELLSSGYTLSDLTTYLNTGKITQEQYDSLLTSYQTQQATEYKNTVNSYITSGNEGLNEYLVTIDTAYVNGEITQEAYQDIYATVASSLADALTAADYDSDNYNSVVGYIEDYYNSGKISEDTYNSLTAKIEEYYISKYLGVDLSSATRVSVSSATTSSFGSFAGSDSDTSGQAEYIQKIVSAAQSGQIKNGTLINMNKGLGAASIWVYYNGVFYQTSIDAKSARNNGYQYIVSDEWYRGSDSTTIELSTYLENNS